MPGYGEDLSHIHDWGFSALAELAAVKALDLLEQDGVSYGLVVELGCGPGRTALRLTEAGFDVLGIDASPAMIALARRTAPRAQFVVGSFVETELPACRMVLAVGEVLGYLLDARNSDGTLAEVFARVRAALEPGGRFVFDLAGPGRVPGPGPVRSWAAGDDWAALVKAEEAPGGRELTRSITSFLRDGEHYRRNLEEHRLRLHTSAEVLGLLRAAGFRARVRRGYAGEPFAPGHRVYIARAA